MTRAQFLDRLISAGIGGVIAAAIAYSPGPPASATYLHGLRLVADPPAIEAYVTRATAEPDGGVDLEDLGPQACKRQDGGSPQEAMDWAAARCPLDDGGLVEGAYVVEVRPVGADDGGVGEVALEVYGTNGAARCRVAKLLALRRFVGALDCGATRRRARTDSL